MLRFGNIPYFLPPFSMEAIIENVLIFNHNRFYSSFADLLKTDSEIKLKLKEGITPIIQTFIGLQGMMRGRSTGHLQPLHKQLLTLLQDKELAQ
jgi:hypothetical protein